MAGPIPPCGRWTGPTSGPQAGDGLNDELQTKLGLRYRYEPARLVRLPGRWKWKPSRPPLEGEDAEETGKTILGRNLFGEDELALWLALIVRTGRPHRPDPGFRPGTSAQALAPRCLSTSHRRAANNCGGDNELRFVLQLAYLCRTGEYTVEAAACNGTGRALERRACTSDSRTGIRRSLTRGPVTWVVNGRGGSPHVAIMGTLGTGKTRTAMQLVRQIHTACSAPVLLFDMAKGDLASDKTLVCDALGARVVTPHLRKRFRSTCLPSRAAIRAKSRTRLNLRFARAILSESREVSRVVFS